MKQGQAIYVDECSACHARNGAGALNIVPALKASPIVQSEDLDDAGPRCPAWNAECGDAEAPTGSIDARFRLEAYRSVNGGFLTYIRNPRAMRRRRRRR
jgi:hypothetical protein